MVDTVIAIDANAIENLWAGGGAVAWDQCPSSEHLAQVAA
jgi:hypothetical protein